MYSESEKDYKLQMHETPQNNSKYTLILFTCELWVLQVVVRMLVIHSYMAISIIFFLAMFLQLIWFDPRLQQDVDDYNYCLGCICFSILIGGEASCQKAIEGAEVSGEDILNFFLVL